MSTPSLFAMPTLQHLPASLPLEGALRLELQEGVPIFRASAVVQQRIQTLLSKQQAGMIAADEMLELDQYEELDDYLSFLNRMARNVLSQR